MVALFKQHDYRNTLIFLPGAKDLSSHETFYPEITLLAPPSKLAALILTTWDFYNLKRIQNKKISFFF